jgi:histidine triad (HIT) family protein
MVVPDEEPFTPTPLPAGAGRGVYADHKLSNASVDVTTRVTQTMTIFKRIIDKSIPADIVYEDELSLAFRDIHPQAPVHIIIIPRKEIPSLAESVDGDEALLGHLFVVARKIAEQLQLTNGYRTVMNCGRDGGQTVGHIHLHLLGGRAFGWPPG